MNKNGVFDTSLIKPLANLLVRQNKGKYCLYDYRDSDNWNDYILNWDEITIFDNLLVVENRGKVFNLKCDVLKIFTEYKILTSFSPVAKLNICLMNEKCFDTFTRGKSSGDRNLIKN